MASFIKVAKLADLPEGTGKLVEAGGKQIALFNAGGKFFAIDNACKHRGGPLAEGELDGTTITCPWHGWEYDIATGANLDDASVKLGCYPVKAEGDDILVEA
ncbi:MAG TPA: Rieske (2Fe-2S) protein [Candidatus Binatus sp.]|nr:Rieske (2Fe-2S) protein [Candidatus Binatus sp.]